MSTHLTRFGHKGRASGHRVGTESAVGANQEDAVADADSDTRPLAVVGIGASVGGLEALQLLASGITEASGMAFVVAQHVSTDYRSMMVDLLSRHSAVTVQAAEHDQILQANHIYVCPPGFHITIQPGDRVMLSPVDDSIYTTKPSIDLLFTSIAESKGRHSIGVILSGTGSDGASGVGAIKDVNGFSIAQDPATAKYDGMPLSAINSGKVDLILPPQSMAGELKAISSLAERPIPEFRSGENRDTFERILRLLKRDHSVNFSQYKERTLSRRIARRMIATKKATIDEYADLLNRNPEELAELFHDLLIGVTSFFRDPDAFDELRTHLESYLEQKSEPFVRIWSVGCSTGEEPYSIAIMVAEILGERIADYRIQIFATDVNQRSIDRARLGRYSSSDVSAIPQELRDRYFVFVDGQFEVSKHIKQMVVFSQHDIVQDPPFLRQDLVVCRNVMIYFGSELHELLLPTFHYVLHPGALLFLGKAEAVGPNHNLWESVSPHANLFRANASANRSLPRMKSRPDSTWSPDRPADTLTITPRRRIEADMEIAVSTQLERMLSPNVIVLDSTDNIVYAHGAANPVLHRQPGPVSDAVYNNVHPDLVVDLRTAIHHLRGGAEITKTDLRRIEVASATYWVRFILSTASSPELGDVTVVYCQVEESLGVIVPVSDELGAGTNSLLLEQEKQVAKLREQLAVVMEQLDSSNEQMQALNEELQSSNEELQSSNEELETTNEELQSTNEELQTAYAELRIAFDEKASQESALEESAAKLREANELLVVAESVERSGSWRWRAKNDELVWSQGLHELLGTDPETQPADFDELLARVHPADQAAVEAQLGQFLTNETARPIWFRLAESEPLIWLSMTASAELGQYRSVEQVVGSIQDVTANHKAAVSQLDRLAEVEARVQDLLDRTVHGVYIFDLVARNNVYMNDAAVDRLGWTHAEFAALPPGGFMELFHPDDKERVVTHLTEVAGMQPGEGQPIRYRFRHKDGSWIELFGHDSVLEAGPDGQATKTLGTMVMLGESAHV